MKGKRKPARNSSWIRDCGHHSFRDTRTDVPDEPLSGLCRECEKKRIGKIIEFIRFGKPPSSGRSFDYRDRRRQEGVSVYELDSRGKPIFKGWHFGFLDRPAYAGKGIITGYGPDGEPLVKILGKLKKTKIAENPRRGGKRGKSRRFVWRERFAVPRTGMMGRTHLKGAKQFRFLRRRQIARLRKKEAKRMRGALRRVIRRIPRK